MRLEIEPPGQKLHRVLVRSKGGRMMRRDEGQLRAQDSRPRKAA